MKSGTKRFLKLTMDTELRMQLVTAIKVRRGPVNDNMDFGPVARRAHSVRPIKGTKGTIPRRTTSCSGRCR